MVEDKISAAGERAAIAGYLPQFDEFAWFIYQNLCNQKLDWIKVADPQAEKLDDIQYSTYSEIHAYQVKWTISDATISFTMFCELIPLITSSWKKIKAANPGKKVIPHLLTNKILSSHDSIKIGKKKIGCFNDFIDEVWCKIKTKQAYNKKWNATVNKIKKLSKLNEAEFSEFLDSFDFQPNYKQKEFKIANSLASSTAADLLDISRFIIEKVADKSRPVHLNRLDIISGLNWNERFNTTFKHDLIVDKERYEPINSSLSELNAKLDLFESGYIFLVGGPGTGKSSLLSYWTGERKERLIKFFAFDFTNPSSTSHNYFERGDASVLFYDLVKQMNFAGLNSRTSLPHKDLKILKEVLFEQFAIASREYQDCGRKTILIIDGLDHVPREYRDARNNFVKELFIPSEIPVGVNIILGSQSYDLEDLRQEIKGEFLADNRTVKIASLSKVGVMQYLSNYNLDHLEIQQKDSIYEISQGHPLYLSYLVERVVKSTNINETLQSFTSIDGVIDNYYNSLWIPIQKNAGLTEFLGLIARINGPIKIDFLSEWKFPAAIQIEFNEKARLLFNENHNELNFFHNSYRQFLLTKTAFDFIKKDYDSKKNIEYHKNLAEYYNSSKIEPVWGKNYHLFQCENYGEFVKYATPDVFTEQLINYRPILEIKQDIKLGIQIAQHQKNITLLVRYLLSLAEIESRLVNIDPASFTEELLIFNKPSFAKRYLRTENTLHCDKFYALKAARLFIKYRDKLEAAVLFNLGHPESITKTGIEIADLRDYEMCKKTIRQWVKTATNFIECEAIISKLNNINYAGDKHFPNYDDESELRLILLQDLADSLVDQKKWDDFDLVLEQFNTDIKKEANCLFTMLQSAVLKNLDIEDNNRADKYLALLLTYFNKGNIQDLGRIYIADLIYKVTKKTDSIFEWIKDIPQPTNIGNDHLGYDDSLDHFAPLIKLNKLLNLSGNGVSITSAVPSADIDKDDEVLVDFERMLCLIAQILSAGLSKNELPLDVLNVIPPMVQFYYKDVSVRNRYWHKLTQSKGEYFKYFISSVAKLGSESLERVGNYMFEEFSKNSKYWDCQIQGKIIKTLLECGYDEGKLKPHLLQLEENMFNNLDIDGRITQCILHSKIWIKLNELGIAEQWIKKAIQQSIGIGYRKDYQFSTWISWLEKINEVDSKIAPERISWFLSHLNHIRETTEGRAFWDASEDLLKATFKWNFNAGFTQMKWQLERSHIKFIDSLAVFLENYILRTSDDTEYEAGLKLYLELYLCLSEYSNTHLLNLVLEKGHLLLGNKFLEIYFPIIIDSIKITSLKDNRFYLLHSLSEFCGKKNISLSIYYTNFELPDKTEKQTSSDKSNNTLKIKNVDGTLTEEEVLSKVTNFEVFKSLLESEDHANSYFDWSKVIDKMSSMLTIEKIREISEMVRVGRRESDFYAKLSTLAFELGSKDFALDLANKSLELSSESGWMKFYDGGTRIKSFQALKNIDPAKSAGKAFDTFAYDLINSDYSRGYLPSLQDILRVLTENFDLQSLWPEISGYLGRLMHNSIPDKKLPDIRHVEKSINEIFIDYLFYLAENPTPIIRDKAIVLLAHSVNNGNSYTLKLLTTSTDLNVYIFNDILMCLFELKSPHLKEFTTMLQKQATAADYLLRKNAILLLSFLNEAIPQPKKIDIPEIYNLHLPKNRKLDIEIERDEYFPAVDVNNPEDMVAPFDYIVQILSRISNVNEVNILQRVHSLMKEFGNPEQWSVEYERRLRNHLEKISLKYSFMRPRVICARIAVMNVIAELIDSGLIDDTSDLEHMVRYRDYSTLFFEAIPKPSFIQNLNPKNNEYFRNDWTAKVGDHIRLENGLDRYDENFIIIGEYSLVRNLDWGSPTETFMSQLSLTDNLEIENNFIYGSVFNTLTKDYYKIDGAGPHIILVRDNRFDHFNMRSTWIAINPGLAEELGWLPHEDKLFAWKDNNDKIMAQSIFWSDGNVKVLPPSDNEVGEGWFVVVSNEGLDQIQQICKKMYVQKLMQRFKSEDSVSMENFATAIKKHVS